MSWYEQHVLPHMIDMACSKKQNLRQREKIVPLAEGEVLEVGFGSGLNVPYDDSSRVKKIWGLEPSAGMRRKARGPAAFLRTRRGARRKHSPLAKPAEPGVEHDCGWL